MTYHFTGISPDEAWPLIRDYHYSGRMPGNIQHVYALCESGGLFGDRGEVVAAACFSIPPTRWSEDVLELSRLVRSPKCDAPLTMLLANACKWLKRAGHNLIVSFADRTQGHHGGVYQAANWHYAECRERRMDGVIIDGRFVPGRSCNSRWGTRSPSKLQALLPNEIQPHYDEGKHIYWKALHVSGRTKARRLGLKSLPYPKEFAACPVDESSPDDVSQVQPLEAAP